MSKAVQSLLESNRWPSFIRGMIAYGSAEAATRLVRLAAILVVARQISPAMLGTAALALSLFELVRVLTNVGIGQRIIVANKDELEGICRTSVRLFWIVCGVVMAMQLIIASLAWRLFGLGEVAAMLAVLSLVYAFMPAGLVHIFLALRAQRMSATAKVVSAQNMIDSALTVALVLLWPSAWAIVLPKLMTAPVWLVLARGTHSWLPDRTVAPAPIKAFASFGPAILASELLGAIRLHADKLLVSAFLGTEALGLYYFAFNAGLGITLSLVTACNLVLFPHLAATNASEVDREFRRAFVIGLTVLVPIVAVQALFAPLYVPIVFGENWVDAAPYIALLACAAVPLFAGSIIGARFRALGQPFAETGLMALVTCAALLGLILGAQISIAGACIGFGVGLAVVLFPATALQPLFPRFSSQPAHKGGIS